MSEKYILENGVIKDTSNNITFHDFVDILILINGQSRKISSLDKENMELKSDYQTLKLQDNDCSDFVRELMKENEQLKVHQKTLESKIVRLKDRVKTFEKHYSRKDIERYKKMENCNCITSERLKRGL